jgi:predicted secreted protein
LRIQQDLTSAAEVQNTINTAMEQAIKATEKFPSLKIETGQYYVRPDYRYIGNKETGERKQEIKGWQGSQTLIIKSEASEDVLKVAGEIQDMGFIMNNLSYELSTEKYEETRDALMEETVAALQARADRVAKALGKSSVDIVEINVDAQPNMPQPIYARAQAMEMSMASDQMKAPSAAAGTSNVSLTINARAILKP